MNYRTEPPNYVLFFGRHSSEDIGAKALRELNCDMSHAPGSRMDEHSLPLAHMPFEVSTPRTPLAVEAMKPDSDMDESWINGEPEPNDAAAVHQGGSWDVRRCGQAHL